MGLKTKQPSLERLKSKLAECNPGDVQDFFAFIEEQLEMNRNANSGIKEITSKDEFYKQELRMDKIQRIVLKLKS
jgi:hypothetical protein